MNANVKLKPVKRSVATRYQEFVDTITSRPKTDKLCFTGVGQQDVYNITAPFLSGNITVIAGRIEARDSEHSTVGFFIERDGQWVLLEDAPQFELQDPFVTRIDGELILGGVEISPHPENPQALTWKTVFYRGQDIYSLTPLAFGPDGMKDIRLCQLESGRIAVFTRPQGEVGGRGKIGYTEISSLEQLTPGVITDAGLLNDQFEEQDWGGVNEVHLLSNGLLGVLSHVATFDGQGNRHYYPSAFLFNPEDRSYSELVIVAERKQFTPGPAKREDLHDVVFSGGLYGNLSDPRLTLYAGISDVEAHWIEIDNPFLM